MNTKENDIIKKRWLKAALSLFIFLPLVLVIASLVLFSLSMITKTDMVHSFIAPAFASSIAFLLMWNCAYKKPGTKLLTFYFVMGSINRVLSIPKLFPEMSQTSYVVSLLSIGIILLDLVLYVWWVKRSLELRKINKEAQKMNPYLNKSDP